MLAFQGRSAGDDCREQTMDPTTYFSNRQDYNEDS